MYLCIIMIHFFTIMFISLIINVNFVEDTNLFKITSVEVLAKLYLLIVFLDSLTIIIRNLTRKI